MYPGTVTAGFSQSAEQPQTQGKLFTNKGENIITKKVKETKQKARVAN